MGSGRGVRAAHAVVSGALALTLFVYRTELREPLRALGFAALVLGSVLLHWAVSLMDPGFVPQAGVSEEQEAMIPPLPKTVQLRHCGYCMVKQPMRARHCRVCQHCVRRFDHHCPWIENCVGEKNHPLFVAYLAVQLVVLLWALHIAWSGLYFEGSWKWLKHNIFLLLSFVLMAIFTVVAVLLLASHLYLVSCNTTTWEFMSRHRISYLRHCETENPFDQGLVRNLWRFFCTCHLVAWEKMYFQEESDPV